MKVTEKLLPYDFDNRDKVEQVKNELTEREYPEHYANRVLTACVESINSSNNDIARQAKIRGQAAFEVLAELDDREYYNKYSYIIGESTDAAKTVDYKVAKVKDEFQEMRGEPATIVISEDNIFKVTVDTGDVDIGECSCTSSDFGEGYCTHIQAAKEVLFGDVTMYGIVGTEYGSKVAVDVDYDVKDEFKNALEWEETHRTWNSRHNCWTIEIDSVQYAVDKLDEQLDTVVYDEVWDRYERVEYRSSLDELNGSPLNMSVESIKVLEYANEVVNGDDWDINVDLSGVGIGVVSLGLTRLGVTDTESGCIKISKDTYHRADWEEVQHIVRHEIVHLWQLQNTGDTVEMKGEEYEVEVSHDGCWTVWEDKLDVTERDNPYNDDGMPPAYVIECPKCNSSDVADYSTGRRVKAAASGVGITWGMVSCGDCDCLMYLSRDKDGEKQYFETRDNWSLSEVERFSAGFEMDRAVTVDELDVVSVSDFME